MRWLLVALVLLTAGPALAQNGEADRQEQLGKDALAEGDPAAAIRACDSALRLDPARWDCVRVLGLAWEQLNDLEQARVNLEAWSAQRTRSGLEPDPEVEQTLVLVREALLLAAEQSRGTVRTSIQLGRRGNTFGLWTLGGGAGGAVLWGRAVDQPGRRVSFGGVYGGGSFLGGGGVAGDVVRLLGLGELVLRGGGPPGSLLVAPRGLVQVELAGPTLAGGWARGGVGVTPTATRSAGDEVVVPVAGIVVAGGLRLQLPRRLRLLVGVELELMPQLEGAALGLRADLLAGPR